MSSILGKFCMVSIFILFLACDKNGDNIDIPSNIQYTSAGASVSSVKYFSTFGTCPEIPNPRDSSVSLEIDMNSDSIVDFIFKANHFICHNTHCLYFTYSTSVVAANDYSFIRADKLNNRFPEIMDLGMDINKNGIWENSVELKIESQCSLPFETKFNNTYIGVKINNNLGWIHISPTEINGVNVIEYALNLTENNPIRAGQKK